MKSKNSQDYLEKLRHSTAHLLAAAVLNLYPKAKPTIGPPTENGFYYDFDFGKTSISESDLQKIEEEMRNIVKKWNGFERIEITRESALKHFANNEYKKELIEEISVNNEQISLYKSGEFIDLCRGGHIENPKEEIRFFKLLSIAGAYWKGDAKRQMLTRIYGTVFPSENELQQHLKMLEEAKKRDHRKLAKDLDLIVFSDLVGPGLPLYTPKGALLRSLIYNYSRELNHKIGYTETSLPGINRGELFKVSGHYEKYKEDMFNVRSNYSNDEFFLKPMNCPQHCVIYQSRPRSYRDLPIRLSDFSVLYRDEKPGEINGLFRTRAFTQDDGHAFISNSQIAEEFANVFGVVKEALETYGFKYWIRLSLHDPSDNKKYLGDEKVWKLAEDELRKMVQNLNIEVKEGIGEAAIYGPKLDFMAKDAIGREWQISTIQLDMIMPERFGLLYTDSDGTQKTPLMVHRAIVGSERFIAIIIEHFAGAFPVWLSPVQAKVLPITEKNIDYGREVLDKLITSGIRTEIDERPQTLNAKIRDAQNEKVPYMIILGDKEQKGKVLSLRIRNGEIRNNVKIEDFIKTVNQKIENKSIEL